MYTNTYNIKSSYALPNTCTHTYWCTYKYINIHTYILSCSLQTCLYTHTRAHTNTPTCAYTRTYVQFHITITINNNNKNNNNNNNYINNNDDNNNNSRNNNNNNYTIIIIKEYNNVNTITILN